MQQPSDPSGSPGQGVELDPDDLSPDALRGLVEEYVTREGTDYGVPEGAPNRGAGTSGGSGARGSADGRAGDQVEWSLEDKVAQVFRQLKSGEARIVFDLELESASIVPADTAQRR